MPIHNRHLAINQADFILRSPCQQVAGFTQAIGEIESYVAFRFLEITIKILDVALGMRLEARTPQ